MLTLRSRHASHLRTLYATACTIAIIVATASLAGAANRSKLTVLKVPTAPPADYRLIAACQAQFGALWAPPAAFQIAGSNEVPMMSFYEGHLTAMIFYLSEKHLALSLLPKGGYLAFGGMINAPVSSMTIAPAQYRPQRDRRAYELTVMVYHDPPITVTCASTTAPTTSQGNQGTGNKSNPDGAGSGDTTGGTGGVTKRPKK